MSEQVQGSCRFGLCHARDLPESQSGMLHSMLRMPCNNYDIDLPTPPLSQAVKEALPQTTALTKAGPSTGTRGNTPNGRPNLTVKTHNTPTTHSSGPGATSIDTAILRRHP
ncbi:hypothetical protein BS17DRAFT_784941 [Gyrodon lividus]|nr:hypothetical protein BS17DRAFT_784941 [Gyrodon lividus]